MSIRVEKKQAFALLLMIVLFALVLRLLNGYTYLARYDLAYYIQWSSGVQQDFFGAYNNIPSLDYPPLFLFPLYLIGKLLALPWVANTEPLYILGLKLVQILFDVATILLIYRVLYLRSRTNALIACAAWALNPAIFYNCANWGQTDSMMIFFLLLTFSLLENRKIYAGSMVFALACLAKFQCLYFAPVYFLAVIDRCHFRKAVYSFLSCIGTFFAVFLPFMCKSGFTLPFRLYFGGLSKYGFASLNAFNLYGALGLNNYSDTNSFLGGLTLNQFGNILLIIIGLALITLFLTAHNRCIWLLSLFTMQSVFIFTTRMHERYQVPVLIFLLIAYVKYRNVQWIYLFIGQTLMVFFNEFLLFTAATFNQGAQWLHAFPQIVVVMSILNVLLYLYSCHLTFRYLYTDRPFAAATLWQMPQVEPVIDMPAK